MNPFSAGSPIARVSLTSSDIADALVTSPSELLINGKMPGTISMFVWDRAGAVIAALPGLGVLVGGAVLDIYSSGLALLAAGLRVPRPAAAAIE